MMQIKAHSKPMQRHTTHIMPAQLRAEVVLPQAFRPEGLYLTLYVGKKTQLLVIPPDQLAELETAIRLLRAGIKL